MSNDGQLINTLFDQTVNQYRQQLGYEQLSDPSPLAATLEEAGAEVRPGAGDITPLPHPKTPNEITASSTGYETVSLAENKLISTERKMNFSDPYYVQACSEVMKNQPLPNIPNYRPGPACANCIASSWNQEFKVAVCKIYNTPILSSYICDEYTSFEDVLEEEVEEEGGELQEEVTESMEEFSAQPADPDLYQRVLQKAVSREGFSTVDQEAYAATLYELAYASKYGKAKKAYTNVAKKKPMRYSSYKSKKKTMAQIMKSRKGKANY